LRLLGNPAAADGVQRDGTGAKENKGESDGDKAEGKFVPAFAKQAVLPMNFFDGDGHIDHDSQRGDAGEEAKNQGDPAQKFSRNGKIGEPSRQAKASNSLNLVG